jgi:hypothetical protein
MGNGKPSRRASLPEPLPSTLTEPEQTDHIEHIEQIECEDPFCDDVVYKLTEGSTNNDDLYYGYFVDRECAHYLFSCYCLLVNYLNDRDVISVIVSLLMAMTPLRCRYVFALNNWN